MEPSPRTSRYDLFKSIVAILLLILFFFLLRRTTPQALPPFSTALPSTQILSSSSPAAPTPGPTKLLTATRATETPSANPASPTTTPGPALEATSTPPSLATETAETPSTGSLPTSTPNNLDTPTPTPNDPLPSPTTTNPPSATPALSETAASGATSTPLPASPSTVTPCEAAGSRSRLQTGANATIVRRLNFRSSPGIRDNWLRTNPPGTAVEVIGGPECVPHHTGAYVWWQLRLPDGEVGWSAEGSIRGTFYFMEPDE